MQLRASLAFFLVLGLMTPVARSTQIETPLELIVLGSGGPGATGRASSSYLLLINGRPRILVDAGSGSFGTLGKAGVDLSDMDIVLLTHLHVDHVGELPGLIKARAVGSQNSIRFHIWGPEGSMGMRDAAYFPSTTQFIDQLFGRTGAFGYLRDFAAPISLLPRNVSAHSSVVQIIRQGADMLVRAIPGHHGDAPAIIYRVDSGGRSVTFSGDIDAQGLPALEQSREIRICLSSTASFSIRLSRQRFSIRCIVPLVPSESLPPTLMLVVCF